MKFRAVLLILISCLFLSGYKYEYHVEPLDATANAVERNNQGVAYMEFGHLNHAITEFRLAIALSPNSPSSATFYNNLGIAYSKIGAYGAAQPCFEKAIELNPVFIEYYNNLVTSYANDGSLASRLQTYKAQASANKMNSEALFMMGLIYRELGDKNNAIDCFRRYIQIEKENVLSRGAKQMIYELKNEK